MEYASTNDFVETADELIREGLEREREKKYFWAVKCYAMSREMNLYLERMGKIDCIDALVKELKERELVTSEQIEMLSRRAKGKMEFMLGLAYGGKDFLKTEADRQRKMRDPNSDL